MKRISKIVCIIFLIISIIIYTISLYIRKKFANIPFDQILYALKFRQGTSSYVFKKAFIFIFPRVLILLIIIFFVIKKILHFYSKNNKKLYLKINFFNKSVTLESIFSPEKIFICIYLIFIIGFLFLSIIFFKVPEYIKQHLQSTKIYEEIYVNPRNVKVTFPEKKRNLIYIVLESEETSGLSRKNGGGVKKAFTPKLEKIALENTNFSQNEKLGGAQSVFGTLYTASSLVSQTSGTPLKAVFNGEDYYGYDTFYSGFYSIGEILEKNGYKNYFIMGSDANFAGRKDYFTTHGNYKIMDYYYAIDHNWISKNYHQWWGYEDKKLFKFAKTQLLEISKNDEPFNFTILTADTHFTDGYLDKTCKDKKFKEKYANVYNCNDGMIYDFIEWVKKQDFYKNTTIVITGDHITMQSDFYEKYIPDGYQRTVYNAFINSKIKDNFKSKNRLFSMFDFYPTTLASLGAHIEGNQLGFGVNLYSDKQTIIEKYGLDYINSELSKKSEYYNNYIVGKGYYDKLSSIDK